MNIREKPSLASAGHWTNGSVNSDKKADRRHNKPEKS